MRLALELKISDINKYKLKLELLMKNFDARFQDFEAEEKNILLIQNPCSIDNDKIMEYPVNIQQEIMEIKHHSILKQLFHESTTAQLTTETLVQVWKKVPKEEYPALYDLGLQILCRFGSTYICEKVFSTLSFVKNKYRTSLSTNHIRDVILLATTELHPDIDRLVAEKETHPSH
uniref:SCAN domain-containing protein 3 n=1 Tax=Cacopsylla melanoneura TaxID=428564 RepID=A0A8D9B0I4_9HEMI